MTTASIIIASIAALIALFAAIQATRSASAAKKNMELAYELAANTRARELAELKITLDVKPKPDLYFVHLVIHNVGPHEAAGVRARGKLTFEGRTFSVGDDDRWPFLSRRDEVDDITLESDRSLPLAVFDTGPAPAVGDSKRRLEYEILYRDGTGAHRVSGSFIYGPSEEGGWTLLTGEPASDQ